MFHSEDWNVDLAATSLDSSLFDSVTKVKHKHKEKRSNLSKSESLQTEGLKPGLKRKGSSEGDRYQPNSKKKKKEKKNEHQDGPTDKPSNVKLLDENMQGKKDSGSRHSLKKNKKRQKSKLNIVDQNDHNTKHVSSTELNSKPKITKSETNYGSIEHSGSKEESNGKQKQKKRKIEESSNLSVPKKTKVDELQKTENKVEDGHMTMKDRRHRRKSENSKTNKYKHLTESPVFNSADSKPANEHLKTGVGKKETEKSKKKKTLKRKQKFLEKLKNNSENVKTLKASSKISDAKKVRKRQKNKKEQKKTPEKDNTNPEVKEEESTKRKFDVTKLRGIMSSEKKMIKGLLQEKNKKSARKLEFASGELFNKRKTETSQEKAEKAKSKENMKMKLDATKMKANVKDGKMSKTINKQGFIVTKLKDVVQEKKKMDIAQDNETKKKKKIGECPQKSLKEKMEEQLCVARFRYINEQLYRTTGAQAVELFADDNNAFKVYHRGYESQVSKWPVDPLNIIADQIKLRHKSPETVIADMGCGSARLGQRVKRVKVHSFDLVAVNKWVTACNMSKVPLETGSVDVVVFCLSLMGTNLVDYLLEANRILKTGGMMKIAEVESRFQKVGAFVSKVEKLGFEMISKDLSNKMFYLFDFKKVKGIEKSSAVPRIELEPCVYKKR